MDTIINLIYICLIVVFIVDISGAINSLKRAISWILTKGKIKTDNYDLKPISCSLCSTWWSGLIYLFIIGQFTLLNIVVVAILSFLTPIIKDIFILVKDLFIKLNNLIYKWLKL